MKKLKVLIITIDYPPPMGGIQIYTCNLEQELITLGHEVKVLNFDWRNKNSHKGFALTDFFYCPATQNHYYKLSNILNPLKVFESGGFFDFIIKNKIYRLSNIEISRFKPDIIHLMKATLYSSVYKIDIPYIISCYSEELINIYPIQYALQNAKVIHCISNYGKILASKLTNDNEKIRYLPIGINLDLYKNTKNLNNKNQIITVSRLIDAKNIHTIIEAFSLLPKYILNNYHYLIIGDGPERSKLNLLIKNLKLVGAVKLLGALSENEKIKLLKESKLFILCPKPYKNGEEEGFGIVFLEAQASKLPVIASKVGGIPDSVGNGGIYVKDELNPREIAQKIEKLISDDKLYAELIHNIQERIGKFDIEKHVHEIEKLYIEAINKKC